MCKGQLNPSNKTEEWTECPTSRERDTWEKNFEKYSLRFFQGLELTQNSALVFAEAPEQFKTTKFGYGTDKNCWLFFQLTMDFLLVVFLIFKLNFFLKYQFMQPKETYRNLNVVQSSDHCGQQQSKCHKNGIFYWNVTNRETSTSYTLKETFSSSFVTFFWYQHYARTTIILWDFEKLQEIESKNLRRDTFWIKNLQRFSLTVRFFTTQCFRIIFYKISDFVLISSKRKQNVKLWTTYCIQNEPRYNSFYFVNTSSCPFLSTQTKIFLKNSKLSQHFFQVSHFDSKVQNVTDFHSKNIQRIWLWIEFVSFSFWKYTVCQILNQKLYNVSQIESISFHLF